MQSRQLLHSPVNRRKIYILVYTYPPSLLYNNQVTRLSTLLPVGISTKSCRYTTSTTSIYITVDSVVTCIICKYIAYVVDLSDVSFLLKVTPHTYVYSLLMLYLLYNVNYRFLYFLMPLHC